MKLKFFASAKPRAQKALEEMRSAYGDCEPEDADAFVVLGGDGTMLRALHNFTPFKAPLYGMNLGTLGFLLNPFSRKDLVTKLEKANRFRIRPLRMEARDRQNKIHKGIAFNEVSLIRETHNSAKIKIFVNDKVRISELVCDGVLVSTAVGSTAYNSSAGGPIVPLEGKILPLTPISPFRPRRWPGALVHSKEQIRFEILKGIERPVSATADSTEVRDVLEVQVKEARNITKTLLFDPDNPLEDKIAREQFGSEG